MSVKLGLTVFEKSSASDVVIRLNCCSGNKPALPPPPPPPKKDLFSGKNKTGPEKAAAFELMW